MVRASTADSRGAVSIGLGAANEPERAGFMVREAGLTRARVLSCVGMELDVFPSYGQALGALAYSAFRECCPSLRLFGLLALPGYS